MGGRKQRERKEVEEWEKKEEEVRRQMVFGRGSGVMRSPQQQGGSGEGVEKRKVADTSFEQEEGRGKEKRKVGEGMTEGCSGNCREIVELITEAIRKEREIWKEEMRESREMWREELREMKDIWRQERESLKLRIVELEEQVEKREKLERRNNIVIRGKEFQEKKEVAGFLKEELGVEAEVQESYVVDRARKLVVVRLGQLEDKIQVMRNKSKLKNRQGKVYIEDDLTREERGIQKCIRERARREWDKGRSARVGYQKLIIEGKVWRWNKAKKELEEDAKNE